MRKAVTAILSSIVLVLTICANAQQGDWTLAPKVPLEVLVKGRAGIVEYLLPQVDHVTVAFKGDSVVGNYGANFFKDQLRAMGYTGSGSFGELSDAIASTGFGGQVQKTAHGFYDVRAEVTFYTVDNKIILTGNSALNLYEDSNGNLHSSGTFYPYVDLYSVILTDPTQDITASSWIPWNQPKVDLGLYWDQDSNSIGIIFPTVDLENGFLAIADQNGNLTGYNLRNGTLTSGKFISVLLGRSNSSVIREIKADQLLDMSGQQAYKSGGQYYSRVALIEKTFSSNSVTNYNFDLPVYGSATPLHPQAVFITPIALPRGYTNLNLHQEYQVVEMPTGWSLPVPQGKYHIRVQFDKVLDWTSDLNPKG